jgi:3-oxoacyl-[acyl-carrier-protein] synthase II
MMERKRVVVTGMGLVTPAGLTLEDHWNYLLSGKSAAGKITYFDTTNFDTKIAHQLRGFDPLNYMDKKTRQRNDPFVHYALASTEMAVKHSGINFEQEDRNRIGVIFGSGIGGMQTYSANEFILFKENSPRHISPLFIPMLIANIAAGLISMKYNLKGPNWATISACTTAANAIADACMVIQRGMADIMVTGGTEAVICPMGIGGFNSMRALSTRNDEPEKASRPFDAKRDGFVMGEGAGTLLLEDLEHAKNRGAKIYAELAGLGLTADAYHITAPAPEGEGAARSMKMAVDDAGLKLTDVDYINAHGTSTELNDKNESIAIKNLFGDYAYKININSTKSMIGHLLGAGAAVEAITTIQTILNGKIHPTINLEFPDPYCDLNYTKDGFVEKEVKVGISNSFGFGGHNGTLLFKKFEE